MTRILVLHGPNLNMLGYRQPNIYGTETLSTLNDNLASRSLELGFELKILQSNSEEKIIDAIHQAVQFEIKYIIINPAAFTHTSIAIRDALLSVNIPFIEVHITNIHARDSFREKSYFSDIARGVITGLGTDSYFLALEAISIISKKESV